MVGCREWKDRCNRLGKVAGSESGRRRSGGVGDRGIARRKRRGGRREAGDDVVGR